MSGSARIEGRTQRVRAHRRAAAVLFLLVCVVATAVVTSIGGHRDVDAALAAARERGEVNRAAVDLRGRFLDARRAADQLLENLPLDVSGPQAGPVADTFATIQTATAEWAAVSKRSGGDLTPMPNFLDFDGDAVAALLAGHGPDDPEVELLLVEVEESYARRRAELDALIRSSGDDVGAAAAEAARLDDRTQRRLLVVLGAGTLACLVLAALVGRMIARLHGAATLEEERQRLASLTSRHEQRIQNGLDMAQTEDGALQVLERAVAAHAEGHHVEVLLADSSRSHFGRALAVGGGLPGCAVTSPDGCPALVRGHRLEFDDSGAIDACPNLPDPAVARCRATCIPMSIAGSSAGVLHVTSPVDGDVPDVPMLESMARSASDRIGVLRAFARSEAQAATDPLTGLLNRRSLEDRARRHLAAGARCTVAFGDLDHFKNLNDIHGHDTGDRALRLFARVLTEEVRPDDLVARFGGEEFVVVLVDCDAADALNVLHRVHARLAVEIVAAGLPSFTASFGVAEWDGEAGLADMVARADVALLQAKHDGRNCDRTYVRGDILAAPAPPVV